MRPTPPSDPGDRDDRGDPGHPRAILRAAVARREAAAPPLVVEAYRLINGPGDGAPPGLTVDRYDRWMVLSARAHLGSAEVKAWAHAVWDELRPEGLVIKRLLPRATDSTSQVFRGHVPDGPVEVREGDVTLLAYLDDGVQTGLFLDQRDARWRARSFGVGCEVLNLFAYTGAFTVHAVRAGALRVTSVDASKKALSRARANLRASGEDPDRHRWFADDVMAHLRRAPPERYGLVIVDPPVFGRGGRRPFALLRDLEELLTRSMAATRRDGVLLFSAHARALNRIRIEQAFHRAADVSGRRVDIEEWLGLPPWDHPVDRMFSDASDRGDYLVTAVARILS